jgi:hypothetical protein
VKIDDWLLDALARSERQVLLRADEATNELGWTSAGSRLVQPVFDNIPVRTPYGARQPGISS